MRREQERIRRKPEGNPAAECNRVGEKYCLELFRDFAGTKNPRHQSYKEYSNKEMLGIIFYKGSAGNSSMQFITREFNSADVAGNISRFLGGRVREYLLHGVTVNEYLERLDLGELQEVQ